MGARLFRLLGLILLLTGAGCAPRLPEPALAPSLPRLAAPLTTQNCDHFFRALEQAVADARVWDAQAAPVVGFPYLRVDRLLADFARRQQAAPDAGPLTGSEAFDNWVERLRQRDQEGRAVELANLGQPEALPTVEQCGTLLAAQRLAEPAQRQRLIATLAKPGAVPEEYFTWQRVAGLYWLTARAVKRGVEKWHDETLSVYATPLAERPRRGELVRYPPPTAARPGDDAGAILARAYDRADPLGYPRFTPEERERLFALFAPTWEVETESGDDRLGNPVWPPGEATPAIDTEATPIVYRHLSHTREGGRILTQLNYVVWFPGRPAERSLDLLAGRLDGLTWRVTLDRDGQPLLHDTIHNCGCYHLFFPSPRLALQPYEGALQEPAFVPARAPALPAGPARGLTLHIAPVSHYVEAVLPAPVLDADAVRPYRWGEYDQLRRLPLAHGGSRSLFLGNGIVPGSQRAERFVLWPMGVPHPGEMRQWGHHATAFFGKRHFDDPDLLERWFQRVEEK